jgi:protein-S-isoprenylcysteine O-methyltransferase Ste14
VNGPLAFLGGVGLVFVFVRALLGAGRPDGGVPLLIVGSFTAYLVAAQAMLGRARRSRAATTRVATGFAQWAPAFAWVPYTVVVLHIGPELTAPAPIVALGLALTIGGIALALWALFAIGRHFDLELEVHRDHEVVRSGPYRIVRHPIYAGLGIHTLGAIVATGNVLLAVGTIVITFPVLYARAREEERLLRGQLGAAYDAYARDVGMIVPFVGRSVTR